MQRIEKLINEAGLAHSLVSEHSLIIDEKGEEHGILFFVDIKQRKYKIILPAPHHIKWKSEKISYKQLIGHKEAMLLK